MSKRRKRCVTNSPDSQEEPIVSEQGREAMSDETAETTPPTGEDLEVQVGTELANREGVVEGRKLQPRTQLKPPDRLHDYVAK